MASDSSKQRISGVRHVAVHALTSTGSAFMKCMLGNVLIIFIFDVTLHAGLICPHQWQELVRRVAAVHGMTGQTRKFPLSVTF